jgi:hypothetical protein
VELYLYSVSYLEPGVHRLRTRGAIRTLKHLNLNQAAHHLAYAGKSRLCVRGLPARIRIEHVSTARVPRGTRTPITTDLNGVSLPLDYRDVAPATGPAPATFGLTGRRSSS